MADPDYCTCGDPVECDCGCCDICCDCFYDDYYDDDDDYYEDDDDDDYF